MLQEEEEKARRFGCREGMDVEKEVSNLNHEWRGLTSSYLL